MAKVLRLGRLGVNYPIFPELEVAPSIKKVSEL